MIVIAGVLVGLGVSQLRNPSTSNDRSFWRGGYRFESIEARRVAAMVTTVFGIVLLIAITFALLTDSN
jgi:hypothetical protein